MTSTGSKFNFKMCKIILLLYYIKQQKEYAYHSKENKQLSNKQTHCHAPLAPNRKTLERFIQLCATIGLRTQKASTMIRKHESV